MLSKVKNIFIFNFIQSIFHKNLRNVKTCDYFYETDNNSQNSVNKNNQKENNSDSFGQGDMFNFDKNNGFFSDIPIQSRDLITAMNNNTQLGKQLLGKLDQMIKNNSETNQEMKNATSQMKSATAQMEISNSTQKEILSLLVELVKKLPALKSEEGQMNTNK